MTPEQFDRLATPTKSKVNERLETIENEIECFELEVNRITLTNVQFKRLQSITNVLTEILKKQS